MLIGSGMDVVFVSRQLGHANLAVTLKVYAHQLARREHAERARAILETNHGAMTSRRRSSREMGIVTMGGHRRTPAV